LSTTITHGSCGKTWTGAGRAHCSGCHLTFSTYLVSDRHRTGDYSDRRCLHPSAVGLVERKGIWGGPSPDPTKREITWRD